jgi:hypothetical protein
MKISYIVLLPLAVSAAVVRPRFEQATATVNEITKGTSRHAAVKSREALTQKPVDSAAPPPAKPTSGGWLPTLSQLGDLLNSAYSTFNGWTQNYNDITAKAQGALPDLLYAGVNNMAWFMSWTAKPVKIEKTKPVLGIGQDAQKRNIRYGPFTLLGSQVSTSLS